jgi:hypothetical protein
MDRQMAENETETERDLGGGKDSLPCLVCEKQMRRVIDGGWELQPEKGLHFAAEGAYGSTVFDPMDESTLNVVVCDDCVVKAARKGLVLLGQPRIGLIDDDGAAVGYYHPERAEVPWDPERAYPAQVPTRVDDEEIVAGQVPAYAMIKAAAIRHAHERLRES